MSQHIYGNYKVHNDTDDIYTFSSKKSSYRTQKPSYRQTGRFTPQYNTDDIYNLNRGKYSYIIPNEFIARKLVQEELSNLPVEIFNIIAEKIVNNYGDQINENLLNNLQFNFISNNDVNEIILREQQKYKKEVGS